ncbi:MAG: hypothetical protein HWN67_06650 [Candidatus Helarchaeota archaeon]|nr:hypothetical protein [Candidatus Helarchaeota archaeon]
MPKEWSDKHKYNVTLENLIENNVIMMKFLLDNSEDEGMGAIKKYYDAKNELNFNVRVGKGVKITVKIFNKISKSKFFDIFVDQLIKNAQYMIPLKSITGIDYKKDRVIIHVDKCVSKRLFRRGIKRYKVKDQIPNNAFCEFNCIPTFQTFTKITPFKLSAEFKEKGCAMIIEISNEDDIT